jgi:hypothetical protein
MFQYYHDGAWWGFDIPAWSQEDARARIDRIPFAQYVGEHYYTIKATPGAGLLVRILCMVKNTTRRFMERLS